MEKAGQHSFELTENNALANPCDGIGAALRGLSAAPLHSALQ